MMMGNLLLPSFQPTTLARQWLTVTLIEPISSDLGTILIPVAEMVEDASFTIHSPRTSGTTNPNVVWTRATRRLEISSTSIDYDRITLWRVVGPKGDKGDSPTGTGRRTVVPHALSSTGVFTIPEDEQMVSVEITATDRGTDLYTLECAIDGMGNGNLRDFVTDTHNPATTSSSDSRSVGVRIQRNTTQNSPGNIAYTATMLPGTSEFRARRVYTVGIVFD